MRRAALLTQVNRKSIIYLAQNTSDSVGSLAAGKKEYTYLGVA